MSDELYEAFRIYQKEGLIGKDREELYETIKDYNDEKRKQAIDAYMRVTRDPILGTMISDLSSYDLNYINIKELYNAQKRKMESGSIPSETNRVEEESKDPTISLVEDKKRYQEQIEKNIAETQKVMVPEPVREVDSELPTPTVGIQQQNNLAMKKKLTQIGYANVVLMSIIVIIIMAIICVFIFVK